MCGIIGAIGVKECAGFLYDGLISLQNRGQDGAGIYVYDGMNSHYIINPGFVKKAIPKSRLTELIGETGVGQTRYRTAGGVRHPLQPVIVNTKFGEAAIAHNGNMINYNELSDIASELPKTQIQYKEKPSDTQLVAEILASSQAKTLDDAIRGALKKAKPTYSMLIQNWDTIYAVRGKYGNRPLYMGKKDRGYVFASEERALRLQGAKNIKEVKAGEIIKVSKRDSIYISESARFDKAKYQRCIFELIYLASAGLREINPTLFGKDIRQCRMNSGILLVKNHYADADFVVGVVGSGYYAAMGYAFGSGMHPNLRALERDPEWEELRAFIQSDQSARIKGVKLKFRADKKEINEKRIVVVDDSIVRLDTSSGLVELLRANGAEELHFRVASPPILFPCFHGIDFPDGRELIAHRMKEKMGDDFIKGIENYLRLRFFGVDYKKDKIIEIASSDIGQEALEEIVDKSLRDKENFLLRRRKILERGIDINKFSLDYLTIAELLEAYNIKKGYCTACFTGNYKIEPEYVMERLTA